MGLNNERNRNSYWIFSPSDGACWSFNVSIRQNKGVAQMMYAWALIVLQAHGVYSTRVAYGFDNIALFATQQECIEASKTLALQSNKQPDELGVNSIARFNCIKVLK